MQEKGLMNAERLCKDKSLPWSLKIIFLKNQKALEYIDLVSFQLFEDELKHLWDLSAVEF